MSLNAARIHSWLQQGRSVTLGMLGLSGRAQSALGWFSNVRATRLRATQIQICDARLRWRPWVALLVAGVLTASCGATTSRSTRSDAPATALRTRLLQDDDVPATYSFIKEQARLPIPGMCAPHDPNDADGVVQSRARIYQASATGPILASSILVFGTAERASKVWASIGQASEKCAVFTDKGGCSSRLTVLLKESAVVEYRSVAICEPSKTETVAHLSFFLEGNRIGALVNDFAGFNESPDEGREKIIATAEARFRGRELTS